MPSKLTVKQQLRLKEIDLETASIGQRQSYKRGLPETGCSCRCEICLHNEGHCQNCQIPALSGRSTRGI